MPAYKKPANVRYTDMCIWIDNNAYKEDCDDLKLFEYLYLLINMLAHQGSYFKQAEYYDTFSLNGATRVFLRLRNKKQFEIDEQTGEPRQEKIKSVLNYLKSIMYPMKVVFEREYYAQVGENPNQEDYEINADFQDSLIETVDNLSLSDFTLYWHDLNKTCRQFLSKIPHKNNDPEWENIYLSCMLSLLNSATLNNKNKDKVMSMLNVLQTKSKLVDRMYQRERQDCVILYHLDDNMYNYIAVLVNRLRHIIAHDLTYDNHTFSSRDILAKNLFMASLEEEED